METSKIADLSRDMLSSMLKLMLATAKTKGFEVRTSVLRLGPIDGMKLSGSIAYDGEWFDVLHGCARVAYTANQIQRYTRFMPSTNAITKVSLLKDGVVASMGYAFCTQQFCKKTGRAIALRRALDSLDTFGK